MEGEKGPCGRPNVGWCTYGNMLRLSRALTASTVPPVAGEEASDWDEFGARPCANTENQ